MMQGGISGPTAVYVLYGFILGMIMCLGFWLLFWLLDELRE